jgi:hypothetical protein
MMTESVSWLINFGMLFGGNDIYWKVCERAAASITGQPDSTSGRVGRSVREYRQEYLDADLADSCLFKLVSTTLSFVIAGALDVLHNITLGSVYNHLNGTSIPSSYSSYIDGLVYAYANVWYMNNPDKRNVVLRWPAWRRWVFGATSIGILISVPIMAMTGFYEWLGPSSVDAMMKTVGAGLFASA